MRELGDYHTVDGFKIRSHKILRSGDLSGLTSKGQRDLLDYGLKYDVDFRSDSEILHFADPKMPGVIYEHVPVYGSEDYSLETNQKFEPDSGIGGIYQNVVLSRFSQASYRRMFELMLENSEPDRSLLFHCSAGQDRTGIGAALIEKLLGLSDQTITEDYLLSNIVYSDRSNQVITDADVADYINQMNSSNVYANSITAIFKAIDHFYGNFANYLNEALNLSEENILKLKKIYLTSL
ncbi:protein-tyrosine-phosphatase [Xylocopilactobacillus apicola]|uniref:Protein-tyrosine-phosphatase n=1 Tax=Xylocopilactobacillus apicola TaxID=2932184 RepID=A0AAU9DPE7_9LACO|nr:protein-tyrosine-phosphatase [Xylocopilactobacillus apicola]